jgi:hypothetical protein
MSPMSRWLFVASVALTATDTAMAQSIRGTVRNGAGAPFPNAEIVVRWLEGTRQRVARSGEKGTFEIGLEPGVFTVTVRSVGYAPVDTTVRLETSSVEINAVLRRITELDTMVVRALPPDCEDGRSIRGFNCRRLNASGYFFDAAEIKRMDIIWTADIFRGLPGFVIEPTKMGRRVAPKYGWGCIVYLINGRPRIRDKTSGVPLTMPMPTPEHILAVEVFPKYADIPQPYRRFAWEGGGTGPLICTVINFWVR